MNPLKHNDHFIVAQLSFGFQNSFKPLKMSRMFNRANNIFVLVSLTISLYTSKFQDSQCFREDGQAMIENERFVFLTGSITYTRQRTNSTQTHTH